MNSTMPVAEQAEALARTGRFAEAVQLISSPAASNDADALFTHAAWRLSGHMMPRDLAASRDLFRRAAIAGHRDAAHIFAAFVANGTGATSDWGGAMALLANLAAVDPLARRQLALIAAMDLTSAGDPARTVEAEQICDCPPAFSFRCLLSKEECAYLVDAADPYLEAATVIDPETGRGIRNPVRTSETMAFPLVLENPAIHALNRRLAFAAGTKVDQGEPLQILRYSPGQEYRAHFDALPAAENQRILTLLVYLNEGYEGGETCFLDTGLCFKGATGDGLLFRNALPNGKLDPKSRHAGLPVTRGTKIIASRWIRARPIDLMKPLR